MLVHLIKKDYLIVKKYVWMMAAVAALIPLFMLWRVPDIAGVMGFVLMIIFSMLILIQYALQKEVQYPKATTLLCAIPYPRKMLVISKYCFCMLIYFGCCMIFALETVIFRGLGKFQPEIASTVFLFIAVLLSVFFPVQYKLGFEKTKFVFSAVLILSPFLVGITVRYGVNGIGLRGAVSPALLSALGFIVGAVMLVISALVSIRIFEKTDLR